VAEKRYQVFVSSTLTDLREEREQVLKVLLELDCIPSGMELFPASDEERWDLIRRVIDDCDYYIVVVGGRYGSVDEAGISYTEREYDYAVSVDKPVLGFIHEHPEELALGKSEQSEAAREKLERFRQKVQERICKSWSSAGELAAAVTTSLHQTMSRHPGVGWIRGDAEIPPEIRAQLAELRRRVVEAEGRVADAARKAAEEAEDPPPPDRSLAQGRDPFVLDYQILDNDGNRVEQRPWHTSWNQLLLIVGPVVRDLVTPASAREALDLAIAEATQQPTWAVQVQRSGFNQVMLQFEALGFVEYVSSEVVGWRLTARGRRTLAGALAIRRPRLSTLSGR
jgi:hypothetical protein